MSHEHDWHDITAFDDKRNTSMCGHCPKTRDDGPRDFLQESRETERRVAMGMGVPKDVLEGGGKE